jgi:hypothetical protein
VHDGNTAKLTCGAPLSALAGSRASVWMATLCERQVDRGKEIQPRHIEFSFLSFLFLFSVSIFWFYFQFIIASKFSNQI